MIKQYLKLSKIEGPLIVLKGVAGAGYEEMMDIRLDSGELRRAKVIRIEGDTIIAQVFEGTSGISTDNATVTFKGSP